MIYNKFVHLVEKILGKGETNSRDINILCNALFGKRFAGCYASNEIPHLIGISDIAIINTEPRYMRGEHWLALVRKSDTVYVYDSFGRKTQKIIPSLLKNFKYVIDTEYDAEQTVDETNCGVRCVAALLVYIHYGLEKFLKI